MLQSTSLFAQKAKERIIANRYDKLQDSLKQNRNLSKQWLLGELSYIIDKSAYDTPLDSIKLRCLAWKAAILSSTQQKDSFLIYTDRFVNYFKDDPARLKKYPQSYSELLQPFASHLIEMGLYNKAYKLVNNAIQELKETGYKGKGLTSLQLTLGYIELTGLNEKEKAKHTLKKVLTMPDDKKSKTLAYSALGNLYITKDLDSAYYYKQKACKTQQEYSYKGQYYSCQSTLAHILIKQGKLEEAETILTEVIAFKENASASENPLFLAWSYYYLSKIYQYKRNFEAQEKYLLKCNVILEKINELRLSEDVNYLLSTLNYANGKFEEGYQYELKSITSRDSIFSKNKINAVEEMRTKYQVQEKELALAAQQKMVSFQKKEKNRLLIGIFILVFFLAVSYYFYWQKIKAQKELLKKQDRINQQEIDSLLEHQKLASLQSYINGQHKERERISRDLHDSVSGNLATIKLKLSAVEEQTGRMQEILHSVDKTYREVRSISHDLIPKNIEVNSFVAMLEQLIESQKTDKLSVNSDISNKKAIENLSTKIKLELFRILQEIFNNIHKHAHATEVFLSIFIQDSTIQLSVEDNGKGFHPEIPKKGLGLQNINHRVRELSGSLDIESAPQKGTLVNIIIPRTNE
ncbi:ATP-binding protein [Aquimarina brevivitae]|nr:histidine kinase [Aquimarina brevivitae]